MRQDKTANVQSCEQRSDCHSAVRRLSRQPAQQQCSQNFAWSSMTDHVAHFLALRVYEGVQQSALYTKI